MSVWERKKKIHPDNTAHNYSAVTIFCLVRWPLYRPTPAAWSSRWPSVRSRPYITWAVSVICILLLKLISADDNSFPPPSTHLNTSSPLDSVFLQDPSPDTIKKSTLAVVIVHTGNCGGDPRMKEQGTLAFANNREGTQEFPYIQSFMALSQNPDLRSSCHSCHSRHSCHMCLSGASCPHLHPPDQIS